MNLAHKQAQRIRNKVRKARHRKEAMERAQRLSQVSQEAKAISP
jgi:hypothetical protein